MGKKKDNTSMNRRSLISTSPKGSNNSYDMETHDGFFYSGDDDGGEGKYLCCGIVCAKTFLIIFNCLFLVKFSAQVFFFSNLVVIYFALL
jgi:hypothetical protein